MDEDLSDLYQEIILSHNRRPRHDGTLDPCTHRAEGYNPLCGDKLTVFLRNPAGTIDEVACDCEGCAISRASGSIMTTMVTGKPVEAVEKIIAEVQELLTGESEPDADLTVHGDLAALVGVRKFPARVKCATLAWHALEAALRGQVGAATTE